MIVSSYLVRMEPFTQHFLRLQVSLGLFIIFFTFIFFYHSLIDIVTSLNYKSMTNKDSIAIFLLDGIGFEIYCGIVILFVILFGY